MYGGSGTEPISSMRVSNPSWPGPEKRSSTSPARPAPKDLGLHIAREAQARALPAAGPARAPVHASPHAKPGSPLQSSRSGSRQPIDQEDLHLTAGGFGPLTVAPE